MKDLFRSRKFWLLTVGVTLMLIGLQIPDEHHSHDKILGVGFGIMIAIQWLNVSFNFK